ncbi:preprotein translocase subunit SecA [Gimesia panareensis]|uniref:Protein translocase subunit SecA n=1 Tax=Gimesia panareensis TaxID=2527978 RepID=A0A518FL28_9PLAN|nr:preprotein translocase subunit SecA [Gimesia panareensis]QDV17066.1 preprotein translocase subunit SecA [Gimesia panareensis]
MEFLDKLGEWLTTVTAWLERFLTGLFGSSNERQIRKLGFVRDKEGRDEILPGSMLAEIDSFEPELMKLTDDELKQTADKLRARLAAGETLDDLLTYAFAAVRESARRNLNMRHYPVQMIGGYFLHNGTIAEMVTGEGKTLVSSLPAFLNALAGKVHIVTVNDYLALRDMEWMGPIHIALGLTVGAIQSRMGPEERQKHYACDITYGTNNEFGFDYLRDNMKPVKELQVQGPLNFAIVDEIDNILIDEARTPLIISGPAQDDVSKYSRANSVALKLKVGEDFEVKEKEHTCHLTDAGVKHAEELAGVESFYTAGNMEWPHLIDNSLKAHHLYKRDVNYVVQQGEVIIVDDHTGRLMPGRQWGDGLHQAVEAKEGVKIKEESQTLATITLQNFFKLYDKLAGMTGTAMTEAEEFWKIYQLDVVTIPTNRPMKRINYPDVIYQTEKEKWNAIADEVREVHKTGRPILVGTVSIEQSEIVSHRLSKYGIPHDVLNAKHHEREAEIIAQAGRKGAVTIATNMAGRGTDIILGGSAEHLAWEELSQKYESRIEVPKAEWDAKVKEIEKREGMDVEGEEVMELGGLHVIGSERHDSRRIDLQLRGRSGRQGDPGSSRFFLSLEDKLMRVFAGEWVKNILARLGMEEGEAIESGMVSKRIEGAQKKVEERHFEQRKHLLEYDEVMDEQRKAVYGYRQQILDGCNCRELIIDMIQRQVDEETDRLLDSSYRWETIAAWSTQEAHIEVEASSVRDMTFEQLVSYLKDEASVQADDLIAEQISENLPEEYEDDWNWQALAKWANAHYGLNLNDRELRKIGRDGLHQFLYDHALKSIERIDFSPLETFLDAEWGIRSLSSYLNYQFGLEVDPEEFKDLSIPEAKNKVLEKVKELYREKEVTFPVTVGMYNFLGNQQQGNEANSRVGLVKWANSRFHSNLDLEALKGKQISEIQKILSAESEKVFVNGEASTRIEKYLSEAYSEDLAVMGTPAEDKEATLQELATWAQQELELDVTTEELEPLSTDEVRTRLYQAYNKRYRPELSQAERSLILEVLDTSWKDHLYYMDHLRSGIGLVGYAQKDPKVEYRREGMKAFDAMWGRIGQQVTAAIFRLEKQSPDFVGSLWQVTSTVHEEVTDDFDYEEPTGEHESAPEPAQRSIEPIVNQQPKVGRNDPCPCGSGKKYKKCCGQNA